jgi:FKBP-type peptidyl-prolyl cis-trans isomerase
MKEGDLWQLFVPAELAYGNSSRSSLAFVDLACIQHHHFNAYCRGSLITPGSALVFELELVRVKE